MNKEQLIKNIYEGYFDYFTPKTQERILNNCGIVDYFILNKDEKNLTEENLIDIRSDKSFFECVGTDEGTPRFFRPKSLQGIENNNGWIKIESEDDLPKTSDEFLVYNKEKEILTKSFIPRSIISRVWLQEITHYQPIEKPKPPIY